MKTIRNLYKTFQKDNFTNIDLGYTFVEDHRGLSRPDQKNRYVNHIANTNHFDLYDNWYLPFSRCTYFATQSFDDVDFDNIDTITFIDNPEHKLSSRIEFIATSLGYGVIEGSLELRLKENLDEEKVLKLQEDNKDYLIAINRFGNFSTNGDDKYYLLTMVKKHSYILPGENRKIVRDLNWLDYGDHNFISILKSFGTMIMVAFGYFTRLVTDTSLFVVEEKVAVKKKGVVRIKTDKPSLFHVIDIKTLRAKYIKREPGEIGGIKVGHERRRHTRTFKSDYYKNKKGETIVIEPTWIGPTEYFDGPFNRLYKVRLDIG